MSRKDPIQVDRRTILTGVAASALATLPGLNAAAVAKPILLKPLAPTGPWLGGV